MLSNNKNSCEQDLKSKKRAFTASCATKYATDTFKTTSKTAIQKAAKAAADLIGKKITDTIRKVRL